MSTNLSDQRHDDRTEMASDPFDGRQVAPSVIADDEPTFARGIGFVGSALVIVGGVVIVSRLLGRDVLMGYGLASVSLLIGVAALLFHAAFDRDVQFRRLYLAFGYLALVIGAFLTVLPYPNAIGDLFAPGYAFMTLALLFLLAALRHEHEPAWRDFALFVLGVAGAIMGAVGLVGGLIKYEFLIPIGFLLALLGLVYASSFVTIRGVNNDLAWRAGLAIGAVGLAVLLLALGRSLLAADYLYARGGLLLMILGLAYVAASFATCSDLPIVVLTRRELGAFFYSPIAYFVLFGFAVIAWFNFIQFLDLVLRRSLPEPVVQFYIISIWSVFPMDAAVAVLTMRLLSEEQRTGTLEVLLTAPVSEAAVVLSKFFAALLMFLLAWAPFGLMLVALRMMSGQPFDAKPLLAFGVGLTVTSAAFTAVGLFFSALTRNQIASALLTFAVMLGWTVVYVAKEQLAHSNPSSQWVPVLTHISFLDVWISGLSGKIQLNYLLFPLSVTIVCLFMTVKWLEARKWR